MLNDLKLGIYQNLSNDNYHGDCAVGSSTLKIVASKTPAHAINRDKSSSPVFDYGAAFHIAVLEPEKLEAGVTRGPDDRRGNKWKDALAAAAEIKSLLLTADEYDTLLAARDALQKNPDVAELLAGDTVREESVFWIDGETSIKCKARPDLINRTKRLQVDLKTTQSAAAFDFAKSVVAYGYHLQEAMYRDGYRNYGQMMDDFIFIAVEKTPPFASAVYRLCGHAKNEGYAIYRKALSIYADCKKKNVFHGYPQGIIELDLPAYGFRETDPKEIPVLPD